ncbi:MAG: carboxypeptidase regulatory-like domain-containing protein, partial [Deltaproteobacteria bacterium]|nr:carboxypeptidase regulatory-like domain-containing protein [Deltaproteobacteria bacterium]
MRRTRALGGLVCVVIAAGWWLSGSEGSESKLDGDVGSSREITSEFRTAIGKARQQPGRIEFALRGTHEDGAIVISGRVVDRYTDAPVGDVEVVFRGAGEESVVSGTDGVYRIELAPGAYRAFVRDDSVFSVGQVVEERLPGFPDLDQIGAPDEAAMLLVVAQHDLADVDLPVLRGGMVTGVVTDSEGRPVANAMVRAFTSRRMKPALGNDLGETDAKGRYELRLPSGSYYLEADHPRYAGVEEPMGVSVIIGQPVERDLMLVSGCVIAGKVIGADGQPAGDGAIELGYEGGTFSPAGRILGNGTFRWSTTTEQEITLRAWPWKSPHSEAKTFACRPGARFDNVVFRLPQRGPDIEGLLVDADGAPVPFAFIDLEPLDPGGVSQQERTDANGTWGVFA